jgi:hypothetical protein
LGKVEPFFFAICESVQGLFRNRKKYTINPIQKIIEKIQSLLLPFCSKVQKILQKLREKNGYSRKHTAQRLLSRWKVCVTQFAHQVH